MRQKDQGKQKDEQKKVEINLYIHRYSFHHKFILNFGRTPYPQNSNPFPQMSFTH